MREQLAVRDWLKALGTLCAGSMSTRDAQAKLASYVPMLAHEFPREAFTPISLAAVGRACTFFPSFGELTAALSAWWQDNAPTANVPLISGPVHDEWRQRVERERAAAKADWQDPEAVRRAIGALVDQPRRL